MIRQTENEKEIGHIPSAMISISYKGRDPSEWAIRDLASRIYFYTETEVRIITKEGLDCVLDWRTHEVKSAAAVDHFTVDDFSDNHALLEQTPLETTQVFGRLRRTCDRIKRLRVHTDERLRAQGVAEEKIQRKLVKLSNEQMFSVDYS